MRMPPKSYVVVSTCSAPSWSRSSTTGGRWRHRRRPPLSTNDRQPTRSRLEARRERRISSTTTSTTSSTTTMSVAAAAGAASSRIRIWRWSDGFVKISTPKKFQPRLKSFCIRFRVRSWHIRLNSYFRRNQSRSFNYRTQISLSLVKRSTVFNISHMLRMRGENVFYVQKTPGQSRDSNPRPSEPSIVKRILKEMHQCAVHSGQSHYAHNQKIRVSVPYQSETDSSRCRLWEVCISAVVSGNK